MGYIIQNWQILCSSFRAPINLIIHAYNVNMIMYIHALLVHTHPRSLVATNSHLLQDLEESKLRHSQELSQMNMNYSTLRKTVDLYADT